MGEPMFFNDESDRARSIMHEAGRRRAGGGSGAYTRPRARAQESINNIIRPLAYSDVFSAAEVPREPCGRRGWIRAPFEACGGARESLGTN